MKAVWLNWVVLASSAAWLSLGPAPARAGDGVPPNADTADSLTAKQARELVAAYPARTHLRLNGLTALDAGTAGALAEFKGHSLYLNGLTTLDADAAKALAGGRPHDLEVAGLTCLDAATARALAASRGAELHLNGLTRIDTETAAMLATYKGTLYLNGVSSLDAETARALADFAGRHLLLRGLSRLDADAAKALFEFKGDALFLTSLSTVDDEAATMIAAFKGRRLALGLVRLSPAIATAIASNENVDGQLPGIVAFESPDSVAIAEALAERQGRLALRNLRRVSPKTLRALLQKSDIHLPPIGQLELIEEPDGTPVEDPASQPRLPGPDER